MLGSKQEQERSMDACFLLKSINFNIISHSYYLIMTVYMYGMLSQYSPNILVHIFTFTSYLARLINYDVPML